MNSAVNTNRGLKKFFFYLILSGLLAFVAKHYIQKNLQIFWKPIAEKLRLSGVETSTPRVIFSHWGLPVFGTEFEYVQLEKKWRCFDGVVKVEKVFVPLSLHRLISKELKLGEVEVENVKVSFLENPACVENEQAEAALKPHAPALAKAAPPLDAIETSADLEKAVRDQSPAWFKYLDRWFVDNEKILQKNPFTSLKIHSLVVDAQNLSDKQIKAEGKAQIKVSSGLKAHIQLNPLVLRKKEKSLTTHFEADLSADSQVIQFLGDWTFYEGHFVVDLKYNKDEKTDLQLRSRDFPLSVFNKWVDTSWAFQFMWLNCSIRLETTKQAWADQEWNIESCKIDGPHGDIVALDKTISSLKKPESLNFKINHLNLDKIINSRDHFYLAGVFNSFGQLDGDINLKKGRWTAALDLRHPQVVFSSANHRRLQILDNMHFDGVYSSGIYQLRLPDVQIQNGEYQGVISVDFDDRIGIGKGQVSIAKLSLDREIEALMFMGQATPLAVDGQFELGRHWDLKKAEGKLAIKEFKGDNLDISQLNFLADWKDQVFRATATAAAVKLHSAGKSKWVYGSLLNKLTEEEEEILLSQFRIQGQLVNSALTIENVVALKGPLRLDASGMVGRDAMSGTWSWFQRDKKLLDWKWIVKNNETYLVPQLSEMREWLGGNPSFAQKHPYILLNEKEI